MRQRMPRQGDSGSEVSKLAKKFDLTDNTVESNLLFEEGTQPQIYYIDPDKSLGAYTITKENKLAEFRDQIS